MSDNNFQFDDFLSISLTVTSMNKDGVTKHEKSVKSKIESKAYDPHELKLLFGLCVGELSRLMAEEVLWPEKPGT